MGSGRKEALVQSGAHEAPDGEAPDLSAGKRLRTRLMTRLGVVVQVPVEVSLNRLRWSSAKMTLNRAHGEMGGTLSFSNKSTGQTMGTTIEMKEIQTLKVRPAWLLNHCAAISNRRTRFLSASCMETFASRLC